MRDSHRQPRRSVRFKPGRRAPRLRTGKWRSPFNGSFGNPMFPQRVLGQVTEDFDFRVVHRAASILDCLHRVRLIGQVGVPEVLLVLSALMLRPGDKDGVPVGKHRDPYFHRPKIAAKFLAGPCPSAPEQPFLPLSIAKAGWERSGLMEFPCTRNK